ncbi:type I restriction enzyme, S subunit [Vreelandella subterranea]|uniref:Type I restriction enzyme, S subunit n=1 Tax=Vreelandella subterranea TaxID=416874 RepID=A0A1H9Q0C6_9GAMM|nr:restriction endonuclease subunit S [Halomonas subterranea]SER53323.1 type I restriction enzyme, S subunit [Halomonas subterranea]
MTAQALPQQWLSTPLENVIFQITGGGTPSKSKPEYYLGDIPWMSVKDMNKHILKDTIDHISPEAVENSSTNIIPAGTPIIATRMSLGKIVVAHFDSAINQDLKALFLPSEIHRDYLVYWYRSIAHKIEQLGTGTTVKGIRLDALKALEFALPPLAEQKIIADKLDTLLAQVDNTKARLERIPEILKCFRQSVLAAAVSGRLTEEWRENKPHIFQPSIKELEAYWANIYSAAGKKSPQIKESNSKEQADVPDVWLDTSIGAVFDAFVGSTPSRSVKDYWNGDIHWVSSSEVAFCRIKSTKEKITETGLSSASTSVHPPGTVMLAMIGQGKTRGQVAILDIDACHNQNTAALRVPEGFVASEYLYYYLTQQYEETRRIGGGNNQKALNKKVIQAMRFPMPSYEEQTEIVRRVDQLFAYADTVEQQVNGALERVNQLTQSILAKAFRGELTAQWREDNPELISGENSAEALLERIKEERAAQAPKKRTRKKATT